jgi:hypothetical protein
LSDPNDEQDRTFHQASGPTRETGRRPARLGEDVKPRAESNPAHEAYFFCFDNNDPDVICVFQLYTDSVSMQAFLGGAWYADYLSEVSQFIAAQPQITPAALVWAKGASISDK